MTMETNNGAIVELLCDDCKRTRIHAPITPSERHLERNQMVQGQIPRPRAAMEPSGFSPSVSQRELWELESGFPIVELHASCKMWQIQQQRTFQKNIYRI
jgi:hypothetical protein